MGGQYICEFDRNINSQTYMRYFLKQANWRVSAKADVDLLTHPHPPLDPCPPLTITDTNPPPPPPPPKKRIKCKAKSLET